MLQLSRKRGMGLFIFFFLVIVVGANIPYETKIITPDSASDQKFGNIEIITFGPDWTNGQDVIVYFEKKGYYMKSEEGLRIWTCMRPQYMFQEFFLRSKVGDATHDGSIIVMADDRDFLQKGESKVILRRFLGRSEVEFVSSGLKATQYDYWLAIEVGAANNSLVNIYTDGFGLVFYQAKSVSVELMLDQNTLL